jgi:hypothetical protein
VRLPLVSFLHLPPKFEAVLFIIFLVIFKILFSCFFLMMPKNVLLLLN